MPAHVIEVPCHSISGLRQSYNFMSLVTFYLIIGSFLATFYVFMSYCLSCSCSCFSSFSYFISYSCFMNTSIHIAFPIFFLFHAYCKWHFIYLYSMTPMYSHIIHVVFSLYDFTYKLESFQLNHPNSSYGIFMPN